VEKSNFREIPAMIKWKTTELAGRKGVRLGPKDGSTPGVIPAWICWSMPELHQQELLDAWERVQAGFPPKKIAPLE
jgi:hypothetical protein